MSAASESPNVCVASPAVASSIDPNSIAFVQIVICRLLKRSANQPPGMLRIRNGSENRNVTTEMKVSRSDFARFIPTIIESSRLRRMLSLNAPWNCVAISAQKPRWFRGVSAVIGIWPITAVSLERELIGFDLLRAANMVRD